jgi:heterokaryon incompatibility protein (HET)
VSLVKFDIYALKNYFVIGWHHFARAFCWENSASHVELGEPRIRQQLDLINSFSGPVRVSIDQSNNQERAQQVALMADVYSMAEMVNIWLGPLIISHNLCSELFATFTTTVRSCALAGLNIHVLGRHIR